MKSLRPRSLFQASLLALFALPLSAADAPGTTDDGLVPIQVKNIDKAYKRPGASLKSYTSILIRPVTVAFSKNWNPRDYSTFGLKSDEVERIRTELSKLAGETFARVLSKGGYTITDAPGENVLDVQAEIVDLVVNGIEPRNAGNVHVYVKSAGEMRILVSLRDSITGTTLYRASDLQRAQEYDRLEWANSVFNRIEAERVLETWARQLKSALDAAKSTS
jgi:hypothetical protein